MMEIFMRSSRCVWKIEINSKHAAFICFMSACFAARFSWINRKLSAVSQLAQHLPDFGGFWSMRAERISIVVAVGWFNLRFSSTHRNNPFCLLKRLLYLLLCNRLSILCFIELSVFPLCADHKIFAYRARINNHFVYFPSLRFSKQSSLD